MSNIFDQATQPNTPASQGGDELNTKLASIMNEQGEPKYKDLATALDALKASQDFIPSLKNEVSQRDQELALLRSQIAESTGKTQAQEEFVRLLQQSQQPQQVQPQSQAPQQLGNPAAVDVNSLVQAAFQAHHQQTLAEKNLNEVNSVLASQYGNKAVEHLTNKALELGTTTQALQEMAKTNPTMALTLLGTVRPKTNMSYGGSNTAGFAPAPAATLQAPKESLLMGAKSSQVSDFMRQIQAEVYREHGINS
jgi:hypothetical protein